MNVSVIIPVFNAAPFIERAVRSAQDQPETVQIVVADDASTDGSLAICQRLAESDSRILVLQHADRLNHGSAVTRNLAIEHATSEYIAFLDADDYFLPSRFRLTREIFEQQDDIDGVYEAKRNIFTSEEQERQWFAKGREELVTITEAVEPEDLFEVLVLHEQGWIATSGTTIRRTIFDAVGGFDDELRTAQDSALFIKIAAKGRFVAGSITEPVAMRTIHGDNVTLGDQKKLAHFNHLMWKSLVRWAKRERLPRAKVVLLLSAMVQQWCGSFPVSYHWSGINRAVRELWFLSKTAMRYPLVLKSLDYRRHLRRVTGISWLKSRLLGSGK